MTKDARTNVEFGTDLMEFSAHGALIQVFVFQALDQYARKVAACSPQELDTALVSGWAWHGCALEVRQKLAQRWGEGGATDPSETTTG